jgi:hypothetical protein
LLTDLQCRKAKAEAKDRKLGDAGGLYLHITSKGAKSWRFGDGSIGEGLAYREGLVQVAREFYQQLWSEFPLADIREARRRYAELSAELDRYAAGEAAPIGRPAVVRTELGKVTGYLRTAGDRLRRTDVDVLEALVHFLDFATGRLFPAIETIADRAGCCTGIFFSAVVTMPASAWMSAALGSTASQSSTTCWAAARTASVSAIFSSALASIGAISASAWLSESAGAALESSVSAPAADHS